MSNALKQMQFDAMAEMINNRNKLVAEVNAATGDRDSLTESIKNRDEFEDLRNQIAALEEQLEAQVKVLVDEALANKTDNTDELTAEIKKIDEALTPGLTYFKKLYGDEAAEELPKRDRVKGTRSGGSGSGGKRIRGFNWVITINGESTEYENAATAAKALALDTKQLQEAFFAKAGVEQIKDAPNEVVLTLNWEDVAEDGTKTPVTATVKAYRTTPVEAEAEGDASPSPEVNEADEAEVTDEDDLDSI